MVCIAAGRAMNQIENKFAQFCISANPRGKVNRQIYGGAGGETLVELRTLVMMAGSLD